MKYRPDFPKHFDSIEHARMHCVDFFRWYNDEHRHSGIRLMTPNDVHYGLAEARYAERAIVLQRAHAEHPERFVRQLPVPPALPTATPTNNTSSVRALRSFIDAAEAAVDS